jgi:hypothetical protein
LIREHPASVPAVGPKFKLDSYQRREALDPKRFPLQLDEPLGGLDALTRERGTICEPVENRLWRLWARIRHSRLIHECLDANLFLAEIAPDRAGVGSGSAAA